MKKPANQKNQNKAAPKSMDGVIRSSKPKEEKPEDYIKRMHAIDNFADKASEWSEKAKKATTKAISIVKKTPKKVVYAGVAALVLFFGFSILNNEPEQVAVEEPQVASVADSPFDQRRTNDLKDLSTAIKLYYEDNGELPSHEIISSEVFVRNYLGEFATPTGGAYVVKTYSTEEHIIGYAASTVCSIELNGTIPVEVAGAFSLHIILETREGNEFYCIDSTTS